MTADLFRIRPEPLLSDIPDAQIRIACAKCDALWQYDRDERIGAVGDIKVAHFIWRITRGCHSRARLRTRAGRGWLGEDLRNIVF